MGMSTRFALSCTVLTLRDSPICPQPGRKGYEEELFNLSEDSVPQQTLKQDEFECLNLNITCPADAAPGTLYPVMVFIHGYVYHICSSIIVSINGSCVVVAIVAPALAGSMTEALLCKGASSLASQLSS